MSVRSTSLRCPGRVGDRAAKCREIRRLFSTDAVVLVPQQLFFIPSYLPSYIFTSLPFCVAFFTVCYGNGALTFILCS
jgi:hypothetical protein